MALRTYKRPYRKAIDEALELASEVAVLGDVVLIKAKTWEIEPREEVQGRSPSLMRRWKYAPRHVPPVVVYQRGDRYVVVDGHHRLKAAIDAGRENLWVLEATL